MATSSLLSGMAKRPQGKVAIITGGASGIGKCTAKLLHRHGAKVIIADIQDELAVSACNEIGPEDISFVQTLVDTATARFGRLDLMFNNAGTVDPGTQSIIDVSQADFERVMAVNLTGISLGMKHAARVMSPARRGIIINTTSVCSITAGITPHGYTASKHAVVGLTKNAAVELGQYGVRVNCVSPYLVHTPLADGFFRDLGEGGEAVASGAQGVYSSLKGVELKADDIADAVLYLGSDESKYVSGHNLVVDGGFCAHNAGLTMYEHIRP